MHDINVVIFAAAAIILLWCGWYAWIMNRTAASNRAMLALCVLLAISNGALAVSHAVTSLSACVFAYHVAWLGWAWYPAIAVHAALEISRSSLPRRRGWLLPILYSLALIFFAVSTTMTLGVASFVAQPFSHTYDPIYSSSAWDIAYSWYQYLAAGLALGIIWRWGIRANRRRERMQAEVILLAGGLAILIDILRFYVVARVPAFSVPLSTVQALEHLIFAAGLTFAFTQHRFIVPTTTLAATFIIGHVKDLVVLTTEDSSILQVNPTTVRLLGWGDTELIGRKLTEFFHFADGNPSAWPPPGCSLASSAEVEVVFRVRGGEEIPVDLTCSYLRDNYGDVIGIIVIGTDLRQTKLLQREIDERMGVEERLRQAHANLEMLVLRRTEELAHTNAELLEEIAERKRIEQVLRASQKKFQDLFENMNEGVDLSRVIRDENGQVVDWLNLELNPAMDRLLEQAPGSGVGLPASEMLGTTRMTRYLPYISHVVNTKQPITFEAFSPELNKYLIISMVPVQPELFAIITLDISAHRAVMRQLQESEEKYRALFEHMNEGVTLNELIYNDDGEIVDWIVREANHMAAQFLNRPPEQIVGRTASELYGAERVELFKSTMAAAAEGRALVAMELHSVPFQRHIVISVFAIGPGVVAMVAMDITARKQAEDALRDSEDLSRQRAEELEAVMEAAPIAIWVAHDPQCSIITGNQAADRFYEAEEGANVSATPASGVQDMPRRFFQHGRELLPDELPMQVAASTGKEVRDAEVDVLLPSGNLITMLGNASPLLDAEGRVRGCVGTFVNITDRKRAEEALRAREEELQVLFNAPVGLSMLVNRDGIILAINEPGARRFGRSAEELIGTYAYDLLDQDSSTHREAAIDRVFATGALVTFEDEYNGTVLAHTNCPIFDAAGRVTRVAVFVQDITDRKHAEQALRESEEKYRALTESSTDVIMRFDREHRHVYVNAAVTRVTGMYPEDFLGKTHRELGFPEELCRMCEEHIQRVFARGETEETQFEIAGAQGSICLDWRLFPEFAEDGSVRSVISSARDITALKEAEEALRTSEERFRRIVETFPGMIWMTKADQDYSAIFLSDHVEEIYGYPKEEFLSGRMRFTDIVFPEDLELVNTAVATALTEQRPYSIELRFRHKTGRTVWVMEIGAGVYDEQGNLQYLIGTVLDITERKRAESALQESEWQYQALFAHMNEGFMLCEMVYDENGQPLDWIVGQVNPTFETILGKTQTELAGKRGSDILGSLDALTPLLSTCAHVAETGVPARYETELPALGKHFVVSAFSPRIGRFAVIFYDITARKLAEEQIRVYQHELLALASELSLAEERERRRIANDLHDSIIQNLALLQIMLGALRAQAGEALEAAFTDARELLASSIQSARTLTFELSPPVLYELGLVAGLEWLAEQVQQRHDLQVTVETIGRPRMPDDDRRAFLFSAVREILLNVVKHARATEVSIRLEIADDAMVIAVEDNGMGFDVQRVEECRSGYGLFSIRERLRHIGGALLIQSQPDAGTRVTLTTPLPDVAQISQG